MKNMLTAELRCEFQMTGANHYLMTLIQSKPIQSSYFSETFWKIDGCKWSCLKIDGYNCTRSTRSNGASALAGCASHRNY